MEGLGLPIVVCQWLTTCPNSVETSLFTSTVQVNITCQPEVCCLVIFRVFLRSSSLTTRPTVTMAQQLETDLRNIYKIILPFPGHAYQTMMARFTFKPAVCRPIVLFFLLYPSQR